MNETKTVMDYGLWPSPISPAAMGSGKRLSDVHWDSVGDDLVWVESRDGRNSLHACSLTSSDVPRELPAERQARAKVGYGGGDFSVGHGQVLFADAGNGRLVRLEMATGRTGAITPVFGVAASPCLSPDGRWVAYVHHDSEGVDRLAVVDLSGQQWPRIVASGRDFYMQPQWSPDGQRLAFVAWDHPQMPWDGSELCVVDVFQGEGFAAAAPRVLAGGVKEAVQQPEFSRDGKHIYYISDASGSGQLHVYDASSSTTRQVTQLNGAECGQPAWAQGQRTYTLARDDAAAFVCINRAGFVQLHRVDLHTGTAQVVGALEAYTDVSQPCVSDGGRYLACIASSPSLSSRLLVLDLTSDKIRILARTTAGDPQSEDISLPLAMTWSHHEGTIYGLYYPPTNARFVGKGKPPLIVDVHGGPTDQARAGFRRATQFFTSRGYAMLFVNYRGSSGYGREYMQALRGRWGEVDVLDAVSGARFLVDAGLVDGERMVIMGGSAGGYTVLQSLISFPEVFAAGVSLYGISNQFSLVADTHKFEARYSEALLGPLPEAAALYRERSPEFHADRITAALAIYQGSDDVVVPKNQAEAIVKALQRRGVPHIYHLYDGEGHGFRQAKTLEHFYQTLEAFLRERLLYS